MRLIWGISHGLQSASKRMEAEVGITGPQRLVVRMVGRYPGATPGALAGILRLHPSTLTGVLRRLEDRGVIARARGDRDRRQARLLLTSHGRAIDRRHAGTVEDAVRKALSGIPPDHLQATTAVLTILASALGEVGAGREKSGPRRRPRLDTTPKA